MTQFITIIRWVASQRLRVCAAAGACCWSLSRHFLALYWNILLSLVGRRIKVLVMVPLSCKCLKKIQQVSFQVCLVNKMWSVPVGFIKSFLCPPTVVNKELSRLLLFLCLMNLVLGFCGSFRLIAVTALLSYCALLNCSSSKQLLDVSGMKCVSKLFFVKHYMEDISQSI